MQPIAPAMLTIRAFDLDVDLPWLHKLWERTLHPRWHLSSSALRKFLIETRLLLVAEGDGSPLGFCAVDYEPFEEAGISVLLVDPVHQRQGIASALLQEAERLLRAQGVRTLRLGAVSTGTYLWPGLPEEQQSALPFFARRGWIEEEHCADLVQDLDNFETPAWVSDRLKDLGIVLRLATRELHTRVITFERTNFPDWTCFIENGLSDSGALVGTVLLESRRPERWKIDCGTQAGSLNVLGVAPQFQGQGVGLALTARAMEILRDRGCSRCYIQWTGLTDWYGKLGSRPWARYSMASKAL